MRDSKAAPLSVLGPVYFHWPAARLADFYAEIADEAPVDVVHVGEVVCAKRLPLVEQALAEAVERLESAGKKVVLSAPILASDARSVEVSRRLAEQCDYVVEANDLATAAAMEGRPFVAGPTVNTYNEETAACLAGLGATRICLPPELPAEAVTEIARRACGVAVEAFVFGHLPLAISARCYHARAYGLTKDGCRFVCGDDPGGLPVRTMDDQPFLRVNGVQTLSDAPADRLADVPALAAAGVAAFRVSPLPQGTAAVLARLARTVAGG